MRLLVAGRHAEAVARAAGAFNNDLTIESAATRVAAIDLLERAQFDLVLACEQLGDGSGLEVLGHVAVTAPGTLRIFAARPSTLDLLKGELGLLDLLCTLPYPINFRRVWSVINQVRSYRVESEATPQPRGQTPWAPDVPRPPAPVGGSPGPHPPTRITESEAFKRARARRNEAKRRGEPSVTGASLVQLAQPGPTRRATLDSRAARGGWKRAAGLFVAGTAAFMAVFMLRSHKSIGPSVPPSMASSARPAPEKALPWRSWQAPTPQPTPMAFVPGGTVAPASTDLEVEAQAEAEAEFEESGNRTGYPSPPPPNLPAGSSGRPPSSAAPGMPIEQ